MRFEADLEAARARIADAVVRTPVWRSDALDEALGCAVWLKCEPLQRTGSFKLRGATNAVRALPAGTRGVVAVSSGNHAQAVAYAGRAAGLPGHGRDERRRQRRQARGDARLRRDGRLRGRRSDEPRGDRARARRARRARVRAPVRRLERDRGPGHGHARAARGGARPGRRGHADRRRRAALGRGARVPRSPRPATRAYGAEPAASPDAQRSLAEGRRVRLDYAPVDDRRRRAHGADRRAHVRGAERAAARASTLVGDDAARRRDGARLGRDEAR